MTRVTDRDRARMMALRAMNFSHAEIGDRLGFDKGTVGEHLRAIEAEAKGHDHPVAHFGALLSPLYEVETTVKVRDEE